MPQIKQITPNRNILTLDDHNQKQFRDAFGGDEAFGTTLLTLAVDTFCPPEEDGKRLMDFIHFDPETVEQEIRMIAPKVSMVALNRLEAARTIVGTDIFWHDPSSFNDLCLALGGYPISIRAKATVSLPDAAWGLVEAFLLSPPDDDDENPLSDDVRTYIGTLLDDQGLIHAPDLLAMGLRSQDPAELADSMAEFGDDPELMGAVESTQAARSDEIKDEVRHRLRKLLDQLMGLHLNTAIESRKETLAEIAKKLETV